MRDGSVVVLSVDGAAVWVADVLKTKCTDALLTRGKSHDDFVGISVITPETAKFERLQVDRG